MAHIHDLIDYSVGAYIVYKDKVLFIHHKQQNQWFPIGGHIELDEDPEQALLREIKEETGLEARQIEVLSQKPNFDSENQKFLFTPNLLDVHKINSSHKHIGIIYFVKTSTNQVKLREDEHSAIAWLTMQEIRSSKYDIRDDIIFACRQAIELSNSF